MLILWEIREKEEARDFDQQTGEIPTSCSLLYCIRETSGTQGPLWEAVTSSHQNHAQWGVGGEQETPKRMCTPSPRRTKARQRRCELWGCAPEVLDFETAVGSQSAPSRRICSLAVPVAPGSSDLRGQWPHREQGQGPSPHLDEKDVIPACRHNISHPAYLFMTYLISSPPHFPRTFVLPQLLLGRLGQSS